MALSRRQLLQLGGIGAVAVGGAYAGLSLFGSSTPHLVGPRSAAVRATEAARAASGKVVTRTLTAGPATVDLGGRVVSTWAYDGLVPGPEIRVRAGDELRVRLVNELPEATTVHWHGVALRNDMDGVPGVTMPAVASGAVFDYAFVVPDPGTYWLHPHAGIQLDYGMQAALVVEDPVEVGGYDQEVVLVLDDWTDGWGTSPVDLLSGFARDGMGSMGGMGGGMGSSMMGSASAAQPLGSDTGDVAYPAHLVNGRLPSDPVTVTAAPGDRVRFRLINASGDTAYRFAIGGHRLLVTHTDGFAVEAFEVDTLVLGMGERYDVVVTVGDGAFPIVAVAEGKRDPSGLAVLRSASGAAPTASDVSTGLPEELGGQLLTYADLRPAAAVALEPRGIDRELSMTLAMADGGRRWLINGAAFEDREPLYVAQGERVRLRISNRSMMFHPMHLHGHTFAISGASGTGIRKDTVNVLPMQTVSLDLQADNPGQWMAHCHNAYHAELGMMTVFSYTA